MGQGASFDETRRTIIQLLEDHAHIYQGGESLPDFAEKGPPQPGGYSLNAEHIRRHFQGHPEIETVAPRRLMRVEAESHEKLQEQLAVLRKVAPKLAGAIDDIHMRSTAGQKDAQWVREKAANGNMDAEFLIQRYDLGVDLLAAQLMHDDLYATFAKHRGRLEQGAMERRHAQIYAELVEMRENFPKHKDSEHKRNLAALYNVSVRTIERVIQARERDVGKLAG